MSKIKKVVMVQPASAGGNFEYMAIPRQGMLFLSAALAQWQGDYFYERSIWFEDRSGLMDPDKDLDGVELSDVEFHSREFSMNHRESEGMPVGIPVKFLVPLEEPPMKAVNYELFLM